MAVLPKSQQFTSPPPVSADGRLRAATTPNGNIELWDTRTNRFRATLEGHGHAVTAVRFSPDGKSLASLDRANVVKVWDFRPPALYGQWQGTAVAFSPDGNTLAVGGQLIDRSPMIPDNTVTLFDLKTGRNTGQIQHRDDPPSMGYSPDGDVLAVGNTLFTQAGTEWKEVEFEVSLKGVSGLKRVFVPEPKVFAVFGDMSGTGLPVKPEQALVSRGGPEPGSPTALYGKLEHLDSFELHKAVLGYRRSDKSVLVVQAKWAAELAVAHYDPATGKRTEARTVRLKSTAEGLWTVLPGGESVVATDQTSGEFLKVVTSLQVIDLKSGAGHPLPGAHTGGCVRVAASTDGNWLASGDNLGVIRVWDLRTRKLVKEFEARGNGIQRLVFSPAGQQLAVAETDKVVRVWTLSLLGDGERFEE